MTDIEIAREAAASAQVNEAVAKMIRSGNFDAWPNVQGALNAVRAVTRGTLRTGRPRGGRFGKSTSSSGR